MIRSKLKKLQKRCISLIHLTPSHALCLNVGVFSADTFALLISWNGILHALLHWLSVGLLLIP